MYRLPITSEIVAMRKEPEDVGTLVAVTLDRDECLVELALDRAAPGETMVRFRPFAFAYLVGDGADTRVARVFRAVRN